MFAEVFSDCPRYDFEQIMKNTRRTSSRSASGNSLFRDELSLPGDRIRTPLFHRVAVIHSQQASRITWHVHEQFEFLFLAEGATSYEFADQQTVDLPGGHFLAIPPGVRHRGVFNVRHPVRLCGIMLNLESKHRLRHVPFTAKEMEWIHCQCLDGALSVCRMSPELRRGVRALSQWVTSPASDPLSLAEIRLNLCSILVEAARQLTTQRSTEPSFTVEAAKQYMDQNFSESLSMDNVAGAAKCSRARLFQVFKESTGMTPNDYLQRLRIRQSQAALLEADQSITAIALNCGFSTSQYFSTVFRKYTGMSPADFRRQRERVQE